MKCWFMFDNHTFAQAAIDSPKALTARILELFEQDPCGGFFVRDRYDCRVNLELQGKWDGKNYVTPTKAEAMEFAQKVLAASAQEAKEPVREQCPHCKGLLPLLKRADGEG